MMKLPIATTRSAIRQAITMPTIEPVLRLDVACCELLLVLSADMDVDNADGAKAPGSDDRAESGKLDVIKDAVAKKSGISKAKQKLVLDGLPLDNCWFDKCRSFRSSPADAHDS